MGSIEDYRQAALDCIDLADAARDSKARTVLLQMAQLWADLATIAGDDGEIRSAIGVCIGNQIREMYSDILKEPIPPQIADLLRRFGPLELTHRPQRVPETA